MLRSSLVHSEGISKFAGFWLGLADLLSGAELGVRDGSFVFCWGIVGVVVWLTHPLSKSTVHRMRVIFFTVGLPRLGIKDYSVHNLHVESAVICLCT